MRKFSFLLIGFMLFSSLFATDTGLTKVSKAISDLCIGLTSLLPIASMLMVLVAGVVYAAGQIMGAETRARANVWATAALTGALMGMLIATVAPSVLGIIYGGTIQCTATSSTPPSYP
jgi:cytochrome c oxidase assembly factor CtaG